MSVTSPVFSAANFRKLFPAFADTVAYPDAALHFAWDMGASFVTQDGSACWGIGYNQGKWQQAADLMGAVILRQLNPQGGAVNNTPWPVASASEGSVSVAFQVPAFGSSLFRAMLLSNPPYGPMLLALLQISASVGAYIPSGRFARVPP